jgi:glycosyltransferase involved in cell wall biosynthesis
MNILYFVPNPPSLVRVRPYNLIRYLGKRGHRVTVATTWTNEGERRDIERLKEQGLSVIATRLTKPRIALNLLGAAVTGRPLQAEYCWQPGLSSQLSNLKSQFDVIHVEHLRGAHYGVEIKSQISTPLKGEILKSQIPVVWDSVDCITYLFEQASRQSQSMFGKVVTRFELPRTRKHEGWLASQFDHVLITSETDKQALEKISNIKYQISNGRSPTSDLRPPISVLPNGVDLEYFAPGEDVRQPETVVFSGKMSYHANITAALHLSNDIMPLVWAQRPNVQVRIVGKDPPRSVRKLADRDPRVVVTGTVPDMPSCLRQATLAAVPIVYGAGSQSKVMEAAACGTPVVVSRKAASSLQAVEGEHLLVADDAATFAQHVVRLLDDPELQRRLGAAGRRYVETHHDWNTIAAQLESIYERSIRDVQ